MSALVIPGSIYRELLAQARKQAPIEACGILGDEVIGSRCFAR